MLPTIIIERGHPHNITLPCIYDRDANVLYEGLDGCVKFYEEKSGMANILDNATAFKASNPNYRIH